MTGKHFLCLIIFIASCKAENHKLLYFDPQVNESEIYLSRIADEITYITLENSFPVGSIYDIIIFNNSIYFSDMNNGIMEFDREGNFVRKIGNYGRGPEEYVHSHTIDVDQKSGTIYNLDSRTLKIYLKNGKFKREISLNDYGENIDMFKVNHSKIFVFYFLQRGSKHEWIVFDTLGNLIKKKESLIPDFDCEWGEPWLTYKYDNRMSFWNPFTDTVFSINSALDYEPSFIVKPGEHRMPRSKLYSFENYNKYLHLKRIFETKHFFGIVFTYVKPAIVFIDKESNETFLTTLSGDPSGDGYGLTGGIKNDLDAGTRFLPWKYFAEEDNEYLFQIIYPYQLKAHLKTTEFLSTVPKYPEKKKKLVKLADSLKETDNPVLMVVRLKK